MPFKDPEAKRAWCEANRDKQKAYVEKHFAKKSELGLSKDIPIDPDRREQYVARRQAQKESGLARAAEYLAAQRIAAEIYKPAKVAKARAKDKRHRLKLRAEAIERMGGKCNWCGYDEPDALQFDHIKPLLRKTNGIEPRHNADKNYRKIIRGELDGDIQLLCACCHALKTRADVEHMVARQDEEALLSMEYIEPSLPTLH